MNTVFPNSFNQDWSLEFSKHKIEIINFKKIVFCYSQTLELLLHDRNMILNSLTTDWFNINPFPLSRVSKIYQHLSLDSQLVLSWQVIYQSQSSWLFYRNFRNSIHIFPHYLIGSWRPLKVLKDQKHDTHLFAEVNQATSAWSFRQYDGTICKFI